MKKTIVLVFALLVSSYSTALLADRWLNFSVKNYFRHADIQRIEIASADIETKNLYWKHCPISMLVNYRFASIPCPINLTRIAKEYCDMPVRIMIYGVEKVVPICAFVIGSHFVGVDNRHINLGQCVYWRGSFFVVSSDYMSLRKLDELYELP